LKLGQISLRNPHSVGMLAPSFLGYTLRVDW
jgi:hypothetical protein